MKYKIEQKTIQHEVIGVKTDCKYFSSVGNLCSRIENGMMRCDEYLECEFKYIDVLKKENKALKKRFEESISDLGWHCVQCTKEADNCMLRIENEKLKKTIEKIKALNLFSLNNSREKIAEINAIINDQKESEER